jgi:hypothetical protein
LEFLLAAAKTPSSKSSHEGADCPKAEGGVTFLGAGRFRRFGNGGPGVVCVVRTGICGVVLCGLKAPAEEVASRCLLDLMAGELLWALRLLCLLVFVGVTVDILVDLVILLNPLYSSSMGDGSACESGCRNIQFHSASSSLIRGGNCIQTPPREQSS